MTSPARKLKKSAVKNIVRFPSIKSNGGKTILVESLLESKYCLHLEFDPGICAYSPQPKTFKIQDEDITYTPDFEVLYVSGSRSYVEVKPARFASSDHYQYIFSCFESALQGTGITFLVVDEVDIYEQPLLSNYEKLYQYKKRPLLNMRNLHECAKGINISMPLSHLISKLEDRVQLREIYSWLALGYLQFDMKTEHLTMATEVRFHVSGSLD
ncbi:hypothetical protein [Cellvibrio mixtus]|uniref:hypothetical protein n=1 Tax=Cellvibrio mixtus TaxID=39650 RepID=UPI000694C7BC|nr:hypothetical protein [Cellvibrio mixtus]